MSIYNFNFIGVLTVLFISFSMVSGEESASGVSLNEDTSELPFSEMKYKDIPFPKFSDAKKLLPNPVIEDNPEFIKMYWYCWELAFSHLKKPTQKSGFVSNFLDEAFNRHIYQWDTIFMLMFARYGHTAYPFINSLNNFYCKQHENGYICREILEKNGKDFYKTSDHPHAVNPPLFSWAELANFKLTGDKQRLKKVFPVLIKYVTWLETGRKKAGTAHHLYWNSNFGSGMDNSPRSGSGWVDISSQMVIQYNNLVDIADILGDKSQSERFQKRASEIAVLINKWMWNKEDGLYYDVDDAGNQVKRKTIASFWPMLANIVPKENINSLVSNLKDPKTFWRTNVFPTLSADDPAYESNGGYWHGAIWAPTNMAVIKGLDKYKLYGVSYKASLRYVSVMSEVFRKTGTVWENYAPDSLDKGKPARGKFVGWSGCGPIALLIEDIIGINCNAYSKSIQWNIHRLDRHGIENIRFGGICASLIAGKRESQKDPLQISVMSSAPFSLRVNIEGIIKTYAVKTGINSFKMDH
jgi:glycogen debranching enzyme